MAEKPLDVGAAHVSGFECAEKNGEELIETFIDLLLIRTKSPCTIVNFACFPEMHMKDEAAFGNKHRTHFHVLIRVAINSNCLGNHPTRNENGTRTAGRETNIERFEFRQPEIRT